MNKIPETFSLGLQPSAPYSRLADIYDVMMSHVDYGRWAAYIHRLIQQNNIQGTDLLDIGCGTGRFLQEMEQLGYEGSGCDPSDAMLAIARVRNPRSPFYRSALPELAELPRRQWSIITCLYDTINYLLHAHQIIQAFQRVYQLLKSPGIFIFDAVSASHCRRYFHHQREREVLTEELAYERYSFFDTANRIQWNKIKIFTPQGIFQEVHRQRVYAFSQLQNWIATRTPFVIQSIFRNFTFRPARPNSERAHFVLLKRG